jgi:hypothetical protein
MTMNKARALRVNRVLTHEECATILAALRYWQENITAGMCVFPAAFDHFDDGTEPLNAREIDELCEAINLGEFDAPELSS